MKMIPKRMRQTSGNTTGKGGFFTERPRSAKAEFQPQYMTVANDIIRKIFDGEYRPGERLPSMRILAKQYGTSVQVILSAFQGLHAYHYVETRPKQGVYVSRDVQPARFYRIGIFVMSQNPFAYGTILYHLYSSLTKYGYNAIIGTDYDGGFSLKQWVSHKHNLDALILLGVPPEKDMERFKRVKIPFVFLASEPCPKFNGEMAPYVSAFTNWFLNQYIDNPAESRPIFLHEREPGSSEWPVCKSAAQYKPDQFYGYGFAADGSICVLKKESV